MWPHVPACMLSWMPHCKNVIGGLGKERWGQPKQSGGWNSFLRRNGCNVSAWKEDSRGDTAEPFEAGPVWRSTHDLFLPLVQHSKRNLFRQCCCWSVEFPATRCGDGHRLGGSQWGWTHSRRPNPWLLVAKGYGSLPAQEIQAGIEHGRNQEVGGPQCALPGGPPFH